MNQTIDNSFFHQNLLELKVLVFVPHEDDEINTCGALLKTLTDCGAKVSLVYTTNGDWKYPAQTRMKEARDSAEYLGIKAENLFFLGYGDSVNNDCRDHLFYSGNVPTKSAAGHTKTYGTKLFSDYSYTIRGHHQEYTRPNYLADLISVLESEKADFLICTDFDEHPDHRMLSLLFDQAIGIVCKRNPGYHPEIWKRFAYSLAYTAIPDYSAINNPETKRPDPETTGKYSLELIDKSIYCWEKRIRIPVPFFEKENIRNSYISSALRRHKSQRIITHADRIINSDEVYWERRTDNLSFFADIYVSSGNGTYLNDFMLFNTDDVDSPNPSFSNYYWQPDSDDKEKLVRFCWDNPQHIEQAVLYSSIDPASRILELSVELSDGFTYTVKDIPDDGSPCCIDLGIHENITGCDIRIVSSDGFGYGLSECEFYSSSAGTSCIKPFVKILSECNFLYEYLVGTEQNKIPLGLYSFETDVNKCSLEVVSGNSRLEDNCLLVDPADKEIIIRCTCGSNGAWDQIKIKRLTEKEFRSRKNEVIKDTQYLEREKKRLKIHNMLFILSRQGPYAVMKRTVKNVLAPKLRKLIHGK